MKIEVRNSQRLVPIHRGKVRRIAEKTLEYFRLGKEIRLNILFLNDVQMSRLHRRFLGKEGPTDVLAFSMQEGKPLKGDSFLLGDIAISAETALRHAKRFRSTVDRELILYVIHGILHLLGYDDHGGRSRLLMRRKEKELLTYCRNGVSRKVSITRLKD